MKIAVNRCYGGFGLSPLAISRLAELNGKTAYFFSGGIGNEQYSSISTEEAQVRGSLFLTAFDVPEPIQPIDFWKSSNKQRQKYNELYFDHYLTSRPDDRSDPKLIQVIEELGSEASGPCAQIEIVDIPDDIDWQIEEYDGMERVSEKHRTW